MNRSGLGSELRENLSNQLLDIQREFCAHLRRCGGSDEVNEKLVKVREREEGFDGVESSGQSIRN